MKQRFTLRALPALLASLVLLFTCTGPAFAGPPNNQKILAGYFEEWSIYYSGYNLANLESNGSAAKLSHLVYAFGDVSASASDPSSNTCVIADAWADFENNNLPPVGGISSSWPLFGNFAEILKLKQLHPGLKTVISLGGAGAAEAQAFSTAASSDAGRKALVSSCINMFVVGNVGSDWNGNITAPCLFDGINIDWEFPAATDRQNFTLLLQEFRNQLDSLSATTGVSYSLSFDGPAGSQNYVNIDLKDTAKIVDFITVDGYNYAGSWDIQTNHASPLFDDKRDPDFGQGLAIDDTFVHYRKAGVPPQKYVMGVPLYGAGWTGVPNVKHGLYQSSTGPSGVLLANGSGPCTDLSGNTPGCDVLLTPGLATYSTLSTLTSQGYKSYLDWCRIAVWLYNPTTGTFYTFDDPETAKLKAAYINHREPGGLGGAFVWALKDDDANGTMVKTLAAGLGR